MKNKIYILIIVSFILTGCSGWLDVKPNDRVIEEELYKSEEGFLLALNGIYIELNHASLYGSELMFKSLEILAQRYNIPTAGIKSNDYILSQFNYETDYSKGIMQGTWEKAYELIANINKLLENAELKEDIFTGDHYNWITGEALALRAFLHFDLLRIFGPVYKINRGESSIPYNKNFSLSAKDILSAEKVVECIIDDLIEAEKRLANDPIIERGPLSSDSEDEAETWRFRTLRLNYYAIKALKARVYLYAEKNDEALKDAREVIAVQEKWFPFIHYTQIVGNTKSPDRVFSTELLFCMQNSKRNDIFNNYFSPELTTEVIFAPKNSLDDIYGATRDADWRYSPIWIMPGNKEYRCFHKYEKVESTGFYTNLIPLIRISEMYYIVAETTKDPDEALNSVNTIFENRGLPKLTAINNLEETIRNEYMREFFGEGQLFFYYKRMNVTSIFSSQISNYISMEELNYVIPLPNSETDYR